MFRSIVLFVAACAAGSANAESEEEIAFAKKVLSDLQPISMSQNIEYCGFIGRDDSGALVATTAEAGGTDWCEPTFPDDLEVTASYHTHAGYDPDAWSEIPSGSDMESDEDAGIDGYVSTPGGRFWYIDTEDMVTFQLCGIGCLPQDPDFIPAPEDRIQQSYTYDELVEKIEG